MAIALVNSVVALGGANGATTGSIDTTGADLLVFYASCLDPAGISVSDNKSNTWTALTGYGNGPGNKMYYCASPTVGTGHTFTVSGSGSYSTPAVLAFSGTHTSPFDVQNQSSTASATTLATGSISPTQDNEVLVFGLGTSKTATISSVDIGTLQLNIQGQAGASYSGALAYEIQTTATARNPVFTFGGTYAGAAAIASFKASAGGGGGFQSAWATRKSRTIGIGVI